MAGLPCAAEEEEDDEDDSENPDDSAGLDDEDGGFVNPRSLDLYVTQRLPGIQSTYATSGRAKYTKSLYEENIDIVRRKYRYCKKKI